MKGIMTGNIIWLYGMSGSGKTTLGYRLGRELGYTVIDSDIVRDILGACPDFSPEGRRRYQTCLREKLEDLCCFGGENLVVASITPYIDMRRSNREVFCDNYFEVCLECSLEKLIERDPKGLYAKALAGNLDYFTGISDVFEKGGSRHRY